jgi:hypothetical protein
MARSQSGRRTGAAVAKRDKSVPVAFAFDSPFHMTADEAMVWEAVNAPKRVTIARRIELLAMARANFWGHASFAAGELAELLSCGRTAITKAIKTLKEDRVIAPESCTQCVVLNSGIVRVTLANRQTPCTVAAHRDLRKCHWVPRFGGWEPRQGLWDELLAEDPRTAGERYASALAQAEALLAEARRLQAQAARETAINVVVNQVNNQVTNYGTLGTVAQQQAFGFAGIPKQAAPAAPPVAAPVIVPMPAPRPPAFPECWHDGCTLPGLVDGQCGPHYDEQRIADMETARLARAVSRPQRLLAKPRSASGYVQSDSLGDDLDEDSSEPNLGAA